jgi:CheY-like chemotaxis protein
MGYGYPAGDASCPPQSPAEVLALLRAPAFSATAQSEAIAMLAGQPSDSVPPPASTAERAIFQCCIGVVSNAPEAGAATAILRQALGHQRTELVMALLMYLEAANTWARLHPETTLEPDLQNMLTAHPDIASRIDAIEAERSRARPKAPASSGATPQESRFIARLSHDLRNPVAAISAVSDMFQMVGVQDDRLRHACGILQRQTLNLTEALENLVDASNLALGKASIVRLPVPISEVLNSALEELAPKIRERGLSAALGPSPQGLCVIGDRARLIQMFQNILAIVVRRAASPAGIVIGASLAGDQLAVTISAGREGLAPRDAAASGTDDAAARDEDAGLALSTARAIAELHHGSVHGMVPQAGITQIFRVMLPIASSGVTNDSPSAPVKREKPRTRVLAIEDNRDFAQLFRHMLEIMGCELDITSDARVGLSIARNIRPELIFCDLGLPGSMDGFDFARAIRADADLAHIPLVAVSGYSSPEDRQRAIAAGFDRICGKPVKFADISAALAHFSGGSRPGR